MASRGKKKGRKSYRRGRNRAAVEHPEDQIPPHPFHMHQLHHSHHSPHGHSLLSLATLKAIPSKHMHPIHAACINGDLSSASDILRAESEPDRLLKSRDSSGYAAWHFALTSGNIELMQWLAREMLSYGVVLSLPAQHKQTAAHILAEVENTEALKVLTNQFSPQFIPLLSVSSEMGYTPLHIAIRLGNRDMVAFLLSFHVSFAPSRQSDESLLTAHRSNFDDVLALLNEKYPETCRHPFRRDPLVRAQRRRLGKKLWDMTRGNKLDQLEELVASPEGESLPEIIDFMNDGMTSLMVASRHASSKCVLWLLDHKASVKVRGRHGWTALHHAAKRRHREIVRYLVQGGSDINDVTDDLQSVEDLGGASFARWFELKFRPRSNAALSEQQQSVSKETIQLQEWLVANHHQDMMEVLCEYGFDTLSRLRNITKEDLDQMDVKKGHARALLADLWPPVAELAVPFARPVSPGVIASSVSSPQQQVEQVMGSSPASFELQTLQWSLEWDELNLERRVGSGSFGYVFKGTWRGMSVAIKQMRYDDDSFDQAVEHFEHEVSMLAKVCNHDAVIQFVGAVPSKLAVVMRFMENGSLEDLVVKNGGNSIDQLIPNRGQRARLLVRMALQTIQGVGHLHSESVIHRDLASRNILVDSHFNVRVADFGFARVKESSRSHGKTCSTLGPVRWSAPEAIKDHIYSEKSDVYSFGVVLYELCARQAPWNGLDDVNVMLNVIVGNHETPPTDLDDPLDELPALMVECWHKDPNARSTIQEIEARLTNILQIEQPARSTLDSSDAASAPEQSVYSSFPPTPAMPEPIEQQSPPQSPIYGHFTFS